MSAGGAHLLLLLSGEALGGAVSCKLHRELPRPELENVPGDDLQELVDHRRAIRLWNTSKGSNRERKCD